MTARLSADARIKTSRSWLRVEKESRSKYGNKKVGEYDSQKEAHYAQQLEIMKHSADLAERVVKVEHHVIFELIPAQDGEKPVTYELDFRVTYADGHIEHVDVKSDATRKDKVYILKRKLMKWVHGITIREV